MDRDRFRTRSDRVYRNAKNNETLQFAQNLNRLIREKNMTAEEVATRAGISPQSMPAYRTAKQAPRIDTVIHLADALGVTVDELARGGVRPQSRVNNTISIAEYTGLSVESIERLHGMLLELRRPGENWVDALISSEEFDEIDREIHDGMILAYSESADYVPVADGLAFNALNPGFIVLTKREGARYYINSAVERVRALLTKMITRDW